MIFIVVITSNSLFLATIASSSSSKKDDYFKHKEKASDDHLDKTNKSERFKCSNKPKQYAKSLTEKAVFSPTN